MKLTLTGNFLTWSDYFTPFDQANMGANDLDLGSGGAMLLSNPNVVIGAGKTGSIYVVDPNDMGGFNPNNNNQIIQWLQDALNEVDGTPAFWNNTVFFAPAQGPAKAYSIDSTGILTKLPQQTAPITAVAGPTLSSNGSSNGIMWLIRNAGGTAKQLSAFDAAAMTEIYNSTVAGSRDTLGTTAHFVIPTVADGRVYVGTQTQLVVYGLMPVISNVSGGNQTGKAGTTLPLPLTIRVTDPYSGDALVECYRQLQREGRIVRQFKPLNRQHWHRQHDVHPANYFHVQHVDGHRQRTWLRINYIRGNGHRRQPGVHYTGFRRNPDWHRGHHAAQTDCLQGC